MWSQNSLLPRQLREYGLVPGTSGPEEAGRRIVGSPIRDRLLTALDRWLSSIRVASDHVLCPTCDPSSESLARPYDVIAGALKLATEPPYTLWVRFAKSSSCFNHQAAVHIRNVPNPQLRLMPHARSAGAVD